MITEIVSSISFTGWIVVAVVIVFRPQIALSLLDFAKGFVPGRKNGNGDYTKLIDEIKLLGSNHIAHVNADIVQGLREVREAIQNLTNKLEDHSREERAMWEKVSENVVHIKARINGK